MNIDLVLKSMGELAIDTFLIYLSYYVTQKMILKDFIHTSKKIKSPNRYKNYLWSLLLAPLCAGYFWFGVFNAKANDSINPEQRLSFCILISLVSLIAVYSSHYIIDEQNKKEYLLRLKKEKKLEEQE